MRLTSDEPIWERLPEEPDYVYEGLQALISLPKGLRTLPNAWAKIASRFPDMDAEAFYLAAFYWEVLKRAQAYWAAHEEPATPSTEVAPRGEPSQDRLQEGASLLIEASVERLLRMDVGEISPALIPRYLKTAMEIRQSVRPAEAMNRSLLERLRGLDAGFQDEMLAILIARRSSR